MNVAAFALISGLVLLQFAIYRRHDRRFGKPTERPSYPVSPLTRAFKYARLPLYLAGFAHLGVYRLWLHPDGPTHFDFALALSCSAAGVALIAWSLASLGANFAACDAGKLPSVRVRRGPYRVMNHPIYVGNLALVGGVAIAAPAWPIYAVLGALALFYLAAARDENRALANLPT